MNPNNTNEVNTVTPEAETAMPAAPGATNFTGLSPALPKAISERHVACVFLLDVSGSMNMKDAIGKLNQGLKGFSEHMKTDPRTADVVDAAVVTYGGDVRIVQNFVPVSQMEVPTLLAYGASPLGEALKLGLEMVDKRKEVYSLAGTPYYRPWIFCITDGTPTDDWESAALNLKRAEDNKKVLGYCVCVENDANFSKKEIFQIFNHSRILSLDNLDFTGLFEFVSNSLAAVSRSNPNSENMVSVDAPHTLTMAMK
ncbi:MAG: VWA domain-containing protein [Oscillospiraceae bacterium]|nr:VWA domain-containing protein [Oscillospiraceae bacterium]